jgi:hypothetical protein
LWVTEIDLHLGIDRQLFVLGQLHPSILGYRPAQCRWQLSYLRAQRRHHLAMSFPGTFTSIVKRDNRSPSVLRATTCYHFQKK